MSIKHTIEALGIEGKVAIVTGGATLIGASVVKQLVQRGGKVVVADVDELNGTAVAREFDQGATFVHTDLRFDDQIEACVGKTIAEFGGIDFIVHAATLYLDTGADSPREDWLTAFNVNVVSAAILAAKARPHMAARGGGAIVNFGSISGKKAQAGRWVYPSCKAAIMQLTRNQALDFAKDNIRVNSVSPGWTWSSAFRERSGGDRDIVDKVAAPFHLLRRTGDPEEVARVVRFLLSDEASFISGADIAVDGGYMAMGPERTGSVSSQIKPAHKS